MKLTSKNQSELEGTPDEIHDFCRNNGLNFNDFFEKPTSKNWLIGAAALWIFLIVTAIFCPITDIRYKNLLLLLMCGNALWIGILIKKMFNQDYIVITIFMVGFSLVAVGIIPIDKLFDQLLKVK
ncbi:hypothetical protein IC766_15695 [Acinetobacter seifertii]|uniref:hypothetical protein n=1 Tax=Acinetobacter seifertii TaxID=1530123 RepID=UPI00168BA36E|nr:hypothetical protein [Acinetobacter seifertii]QNY13513.1 hypothetical protein IC766_15695 [Acinetobacter seifertii]